MKHLLILTSTLPRWKGDSEAPFVLNLARALQQRYRITILAPHHQGALENEEIESVKIIRFRYAAEKNETLCYGAGMYPNFKKSFYNKLILPFYFYHQWQAIKKIIKTDRPDLINAWWIFPQGILAARAQKKFNIPYVNSTAGTDLFLLDRPGLSFLKHIALKRASSNIVLSWDFATRLAKDVPANKIKVIPLGLFPGQFTTQDKPPINPKKGYELLAVGRLTEQKGFHHLIYAVAKLKREGHKPHLTLVGEGSFKTALEKIVQEQDLQNDVFFAGPVPNSNLQHYYHKADIFILPSVEYEALGVVLIEAMASGTPVIGTSVGGIPDIITEKTGTLIPDKSPSAIVYAIQELIAQKEQRRAKVEEGIKHVNRTFLWPAIAEKYQELFASIG